MKFSRYFTKDFIKAKEEEENHANVSFDSKSPFFQSEFCEIKKKYDAARERLENDVKDITELIQVRKLILRS